MDTAALITVAFGHYDLIPVGKDSKVSLGTWKEKTFEIRELLYHATCGCNVAARVGKTPGGRQVLVIDRDARDMASWKLLRKHAIAHRCNMATVTASGNSHYWFALEREMADLRTRIRLAVAGEDDSAEKVAADVKATGYVLMPGSTIGGRAYAFVEGKGLKRPEDLRTVPESFLEMLMTTASDDKTGTKIDINAAASNVNTMFDTKLNTNSAGANTRGIRNPEAWCLRVKSEMGNNGSAGLVRVVCCMRDCRRSAAETLRYLKEVWNPACATPPWSDSELEYAVGRHFKGE